MDVRHDKLQEILRLKGRYENVEQSKDKKKIDDKTNYLFKKIRKKLFPNNPLYTHHPVETNNRRVAQKRKKQMMLIEEPMKENAAADVTAEEVVVTAEVVTAEAVETRLTSRKPRVIYNVAEGIAQKSPKRPKHNSEEKRLEAQNAVEDLNMQPIQTEFQLKVNEIVDLVGNQITMTSSDPIKIHNVLEIQKDNGKYELFMYFTPTTKWYTDKRKKHLKAQGGISTAVISHEALESSAKRIAVEERATDRDAEAEQDLIDEGDTGELRRKQERERIAAQICKDNNTKLSTGKRTSRHNNSRL